jgi:hypothetical protein
VVPRRWVIGLVAALACVALSAAQETGGGGGGFTAGGEGAGTLRAPNRFEQFISKLKMDSKTQAPQVSALLQEVAKEANPVAAQMSQLQNQLLNAFLQSKPDVEIAPLLDAYTDAAARMTGLEAKVFGQIHAMLKPNQVGGSVQAFDLMAGWLQPPPPSAGRRGGGGRGGTQ